jgi:hypothetical protein
MVPSDDLSKVLRRPYAGITVLFPAPIHDGDPDWRHKHIYTAHINHTYLAQLDKHSHEPCDLVADLFAGMV